MTSCLANFYKDKKSNCKMPVKSTLQEGEDSKKSFSRATREGAKRPEPYRTTEFLNDLIAYSAEAYLLALPPEDLNGRNILMFLIWNSLLMHVKVTLKVWPLIILQTYIYIMIFLLFLGQKMFIITKPFLKKHIQLLLRPLTEAIEILFSPNS
ncbi:hypothetical protein CDL12_25913 [Handroanthus impetiginosus]|uniref:Uncharacterized protein n=1 Tax=Handroanthus impetiginosus TaxID=429701 RepID=A0A2G9G8F5_9LAMI|nr:hypothetical protein CDL12_25913 [Handroanthus impetiginosus]